MDFTILRQNLKGITFDLWGTLFRDDYYPPDQPSFRERRTRFFMEQLTACGITVDAARAQQAYEHARNVFDELWKQQKAFDARLGIQVMLDFLDARVPDEVQETLVRYFQEVVNQATLKLPDGARECLHALHGRYRLGIISDTGWVPGRVIRQQLRRNRILHYFSTLVFSDEIGHTKPHPLLFQTAAASLGIQPQQCLHVGDLPFTDIYGAKAAGFYTAWINKPEFQQWIEKEAYRPDLIVQSVADLQEMLLT